MSRSKLILSEDPEKNALILQQAEERWQRQLEKEAQREMMPIRIASIEKELLKLIEIQAQRETAYLLLPRIEKELLELIEILKKAES